MCCCPRLPEEDEVAVTGFGTSPPLWEDTIIGRNTKPSFSAAPNPDTFILLNLSCCLSSLFVTSANSVASTIFLYLVVGGVFLFFSPSAVVSAAVVVSAAAAAAAVSVSADVNAFTSSTTSIKQRILGQYVTGPKCMEVISHRDPGGN